MKKAFGLLPLFPILLKRKKRQQRFLLAHFAEELNYIQKSDDTLHQKLLYYATWGVVSISEVFADLNKRKLSHEERYLASALSILYALADHMVDELKLNNSETIQYIKGKESKEPTIIWAQQLLKELQQQHAITEYLSEAIEAQLASKEQSAVADVKKVRELTFTKGSLTMLLYRQLIDIPKVNKEKEAVLQLGYTLQLADDIIDAYDDTAEQIHTTANAIDLNAVENYFQSQIAASKRRFFDCYGHSAKTRKAFLQFELLFGISHLALKRFHKMQVTHFTPTAISQHPRSKFIIDMEKPTEALRALWMAVRP